MTETMTGTARYSIKGERDMANWTDDDLQAIGAASELNIAPMRRDGTPRTTVPIWVVPADGDLYVRSWHGATGSWYRGAQQTGQALVSAPGRKLQVGLEPVRDDATNDAIDRAYREKYGASRYVAEMIRPDARATTLKLVPQLSDQPRTSRS